MALWRPAFRPRRFESPYESPVLGEKLSGGGVKIMRRQNIYKGAVGVREVGGGRGWAKGRNHFRKNFTVLKIVAQCRKYPIPYLNTLRDHLCSKPNAIAYLNRLPKLYPILIH